MVHETAARNTARASVWTLQTELLTPQHLVDALIDRGFLPGITPVGQEDGDRTRAKWQPRRGICLGDGLANHLDLETQ